MQPCSHYAKWLLPVCTIGVPIKFVTSTEIFRYITECVGNIIGLLAVNVCIGITDTHYFITVISRGLVGQGLTRIVGNRHNIKVNWMSIIFFRNCPLDTMVLVKVWKLSDEALFNFHSRSSLGILTEIIISFERCKLEIVCICPGRRRNSYGKRYYENQANNESLHMLSTVPFCRAILLRVGLLSAVWHSCVSWDNTLAWYPVALLISSTASGTSTVPSRLHGAIISRLVLF